MVVVNLENTFVIYFKCTSSLCFLYFQLYIVFYLLLVYIKHLLSMKLFFKLFRPRNLTDLEQVTLVVVQWKSKYWYK